MATITIASSRLGSVRMMSISRMIAISIDAAREAGDQPQRDADDDRERDHRDADQQRQARAVDQPRQDVAADRIGAEQVRARSARPAMPAAGGRRRCWSGRAGRARSRWRTTAISSTDDDDHEPGDRAVVGAEIAPELAQRPGRRGDARRASAAAIRCVRSCRPPDARIDDAVGDVDQQVDHHHHDARAAACRPAAPGSRGG